VGLRSDLPLTKEGEQQAHNLADFFINNKIIPNAIYCGQLQRQIKTAEIIASHFNHHIHVQQNSAFDEIDYGQWEGLSQIQIIEKWELEYTKWQNESLWPNSIFKGSEEEHLSKIKDWFTIIASNSKENDNIFIVTSQGIMRYFLLILTPIIYLDAIKQRNMSKYKIKTGNYCHFQISLKENQLVVWDHPW
jgi:broad specificity phosphatase PhoE